MDVEPRPRRRCLTITTPTEIAASTAMAIRIGTRGEEPPPLCEAGAPVGWPVVCTGGLPLPVGPLPGLPCPVPLSLPATGEPLPFDDEPPAEDPAPDEFEPVDPVAPFGAEAPPSLDALAAGWWGAGGFPVAVGGASEYCTPLESA